MNPAEYFSTNLIKPMNPQTHSNLDSSAPRLHAPPGSVREYLASIGRKGGKATGAVKARTPAQARAAARTRWGKARQ